MSDKPQSTLVAWIEMWHPQTDTTIKTVPEPCESRADARLQFNELHKLISKWTTEYDGIILDTMIGTIRLPSSFIAGAILKIRTAYESGETVEEVV